MNKRDKRITSYFVLFSLLIVLGVAFAILQANLQINGIAKISENQWNVHFENIVVNQDSVSIGTGDTAATIDPNNPLKVDFSVTLSLPGDFYEFTVDAKNDGTIDAMIGTFTKTLKVNNLEIEVPDYLIYSVTYENDIEILENQILAKNTKETYKVRVEFKTDIDEEDLPEATTLSMAIEPVYIQADDNAIKTWPYNPCTYNGELVQGAEYVNGQYTYRYMQEMGYSSWTNITNDGWGVTLTDKDSTDPVTSRLCTIINNKPIVSMRNMFSQSKATSIDTSSFDTENVINMSNMFGTCSNLTSLDLESFNTKNVTSMRDMMNGCSNLENLNIDSFDTSNVRDMLGMFASCSSLESLNLENFDTSKVTTMSAMFARDSNLRFINLESFNTINVIDVSNMFSGCSSLESINLENFVTSSVTVMSAMFKGCSNLHYIDLHNFDVINVDEFGDLFSNCTGLTSINLDNWHLSMMPSGIFSGTTSLKTISAKNWVLPSNFQYGFFTNMAGGTSIEEIDVTGWDLSNCTDITGLFFNSKGSGLKRIIGLNTWNTSNVRTMNVLFKGLSSLQSLDLSSWDMTNVTNTDLMFDQCTSVSTAYARTSADAAILNASINKPSNITFVVKA